MLYGLAVCVVVVVGMLQMVQLNVLNGKCACVRAKNVYFFYDKF